MKKPALVILAAGMGSRYGGLKQMDPMDPMGHAIIDYSIYDAKRAGFGKVVFVIKKAIEKDFKETVGARVPEGMEVCYAYQEVDALPEGYNVPEGRVKPWGTAHAVLCAKPFRHLPRCPKQHHILPQGQALLHGLFCRISKDFYGSSSRWIPECPSGWLF